MNKKALSVIAFVLLASFYFCAAGSMLCFLIYRLTLNSSIFQFGDTLRPFWMLHPAPLVALFFKGKQRFLPLIVYLLCAISLVALTGGV